MDLSPRRAGHETVSSALAVVGDDRLAGMVSRAVPRGAGIGGVTGRMDVSGVPVFVKRVPLTDVELRAVPAGAAA